MQATLITYNLLCLFILILPSYWASKYVVTVGDRSNIYFSFSSHSHISISLSSSYTSTICLAVKRK